MRGGGRGEGAEGREVNCWGPGWEEVMVVPPGLSHRRGAAPVLVAEGKPAAPAEAQQGDGAVSRRVKGMGIEWDGY